MEDTLVPLGLFLMMGVVVWTIMFFRFRARQELQLTLRSSVEAGQVLSPEALEDLVAAMQPKKSDLRRGLLWMAIALGIAVCSFVINDDEARALIPKPPMAEIIGLAYFILWRLGGDK